MKVGLPCPMNCESWEYHAANATSNGIMFGTARLCFSLGRVADKPYPNQSGDPPGFNATLYQN